MSSRPPSGLHLSPSASSPGDEKPRPDKSSGSTIPSKRSARSLNPDQLARKRANDREAQRAIRERTKSQIETLERRIQELESGEAFQKLQDVILERDKLQVENDEIRRRLESALNLLRPVIEDGPRRIHIDTKSKSDSHSLPNLSPFSAMQSHSDSGQNISHSAVSGSTDPALFQENNTDVDVPTLNNPSWDWLNDSSRVHGLHCRQMDDNDSQQWSSLHKGTSASSYDNPIDVLRKNFPVEREANLGEPFETASSYLSSLQTEPTRILDPSETLPPEPPPVETQLPYNLPPTCRVDSIIQDYCFAKRRHLAAGATASEIVGRPYADFTNYLHPEKNFNEHSISNLFIELQQAMSTMPSWPERIAQVHMNVLFLRWYICPTSDNYHAMPEFLRPIQAQVKIAHPIWVDYLPWPRMRAKLVNCYAQVPLDTFFMPYTKTLSVNWPDGKDPHSCLDNHPEDGLPRMDPAIAAHVFQLSNWTLGKEFADAIPLLADTVRIK